MADTTAVTAEASSSAPRTASEALLAARPPETDRFTYLTLIEQNLSADVLPTLHEVLQDAPLTQEIGWDLVDMFVPLLPASEACLDDVARLGNPREVILKVLEVLEGLKARGNPAVEGDDDEEDDEDEDEENNDDKEEEENKEGPAAAKRNTQTFVVLLGMLGLLHRRIKTKYPSRFLETTLRTILAAYRPERPAMTTAILGLVRSLAGRRRPPPPTRHSSHLSGVTLLKSEERAGGKETSEGGTTAKADGSSPSLETLARSTSAIGQVAFNSGRPDDAAVSVPDPEAEADVGPAEGALQQRLLQSFVTCILEAYVNAHDMAWAPRLLEHYHPERLVPGRPTALQSFREDPDRVAQDSAVGQLVALALDLGLKCSDAFVHSVCQGPVRRHPLSTVDASRADDPETGIPLSTGGTICLLAYWVFSADVFQANAPVPHLHVFPDHHAILDAFFADEATAQIKRSPGTVEAIVALGLWLDHHGRYAAFPDQPAVSYMPYHHLLTLCAVFHPTLVVRNAATALAGAVLHADPDPDDRLKILQDLLENCMFASLRACAVSWLREEIVAASQADGTKSSSSSSSLFSSPDAVEQLQYTIFPDLRVLRDTARERAAAAGEATDELALLDYWVHNAPFLLQAANFAVFLFASDHYRSTVVPPGMGPAIEQRFVEPLIQGAAHVQHEIQEKGGDASGGDASEGHDHLHSSASDIGLARVEMELDIVNSRLRSLQLS